MKYELLESSCKNDEEKLYDLDSITAENLRFELDYVGISAHLFYYYQLAKQNLVELVKCVESNSGKADYAQIIEGNRLLFNYTSSFYAYVTYFQNNFFDDAKVITSKLYRQYFEYWFVLNLQKFLMHEKVCAACIAKNCSANGELGRFCYLKEQLLKSSNIKKKFKEELARLGGFGEINLLPILKKQFKIIKELQESILFLTANNLLRYFNHLSTFVKNKNETSLVRDGFVVAGILDTMCRYYKNLTYFVAEEDDLDCGGRLKTIYAKFSNFYYGDLNVYLYD